ncbi:hypothetical protein [uncultured Serinicoccus sp.]|uniref:hypothetical protein n=1 Tax=uncultured Serinicoccus sp. TaxID=735514 RepID=UPI00262DB5BD|nr:hypothetical protein [uncultured Serinicoccus sp.]
MPDPPRTVRDCTGYAAQQGEFTAYPVQSLFSCSGWAVDNVCEHGRGAGTLAR